MAAVNSEKDRNDGPVAYPLPRDFRNSIRLNYNHMLMQRIFGYLINPVILPVDGVDQTSSKFRIADAGCATCAWTIECATRYPGADITGFDISDAQFPHKSSLPPNTSLVVQDCFKPFHDSFLGKFDIVHARFFLCAVNNPDAPKILRNLITLLKPGGFIQWIEPRPFSVKVHKSDVNLVTRAFDKFCEVWRKPKPWTSYEWVESLPQTFREAGLEMVTVDVKPTDSVNRPLWTISNLAGVDEMTDRGMEGGLENPDAIRKFLNELNTEMHAGAYLDTTFQCVIGKKRL